MMDRNTLYNENNMETMGNMPDCFVDSIVTDPPYELGFMGKSWDRTGIAHSVELQYYRTKPMIKVYIACPYTKGDVAVNVKNSMDVAEELIESGFLPFNPLYSHFQHMAHPRPYDDWMNMDIEWLKSCDCVLRIPGESKGADLEVNYAISHGIPVFYSIVELMNHYA